jgi:hypothetical protein
MSTASTASPVACQLPSATFRVDLLHDDGLDVVDRTEVRKASERGR